MQQQSLSVGEFGRGQKFLRSAQESKVAKSCKRDLQTSDSDQSLEASKLPDVKDQVKRPNGGKKET
jgi:hypothetical protein